MKPYFQLSSLILTLLCLIIVSPCRAASVEELEDKVSGVIGELARAESQLVQSRRKATKTIFYQGNFSLGHFQQQNETNPLQKFNLQISAKPTEQVAFGVGLDFPFSREQLAFASPEVAEIFINVKTERVNCQVGTFWLKLSSLLLEGDYLDLTGVPSIYRLKPEYSLSQQLKRPGELKYEGVHLEIKSNDLLSSLEMLAAREEKAGLLFTFGFRPTIKKGFAELSSTWLRQSHEGINAFTEINLLSGNCKLTTFLGEMDLELAVSKYDPEKRVGDHVEDLKKVYGKAWRAAWEFEKGSFLAGFNWQKQEQEFIPISQKSLRPTFSLIESENEFSYKGEARSFYLGAKTNKGYSGIVNQQIEIEDGVVNVLTLKYDKLFHLGGKLALRYIESQGWPIGDDKSKELVAGIDFPLTRQVHFLIGWKGSLQEEKVTTGHGLGMRVATINQGGLLEFNWQRLDDSKEHFELVARVLF